MAVPHLEYICLYVSWVASVSKQPVHYAPKGDITGHTVTHTSQHQKPERGQSQWGAKCGQLNPKCGFLAVERLSSC